MATKLYMEHPRKQTLTAIENQDGSCFQSSAVNQTIASTQCFCQLLNIHLLLTRFDSAFRVVRSPLAFVFVEVPVAYRDRLTAAVADTWVAVSHTNGSSVGLLRYSIALSNRFGSSRKAPNPVLQW